MAAVPTRAAAGGGRCRAKKQKEGAQGRDAMLGRGFLPQPSEGDAAQLPEPDAGRFPKRMGLGQRYPSARDVARAGRAIAGTSRRCLWPDAGSVGRTTLDHLAGPDWAKPLPAKAWRERLAFVCLG